MATKYTTTIMHGAHQFYVGCYSQPLLKIKIMRNLNPKTKTQEKEKKPFVIGSNYLPQLPQFLSQLVDFELWTITF